MVATNRACLAKVSYLCHPFHSSLASRLHLGDLFGVGRKRVTAWDGDCFGRLLRVLLSGSAMRSGQQLWFKPCQLSSLALIPNATCTAEISSHLQRRSPSGRVFISHPNTHSFGLLDLGSLPELLTVKEPKNIPYSFTNLASKLHQARSEVSERTMATWPAPSSRAGTSKVIHNPAKPWVRFNLP